MKLDRLDLTWVQLLLFVLAAAAILYAVYQRALDLLPPDSVTFAAGSEGSAYYDLAQRYRSILAESDITVEIIETAGSLENAERVGGPEADADVALLQGGVPVPEGRPVEALAAVFLEPLWIMNEGPCPRRPTRPDGRGCASQGVAKAAAPVS